ncbi:MAG TPA: FHA domain-containing protein [Solirubrobacteraceae bacterium]|nr:FHA domain-containing protein [Solirubrobacteraceae bacterium]
MLDPVSVALKFGFLAVLYLFLLWLARSALKDLRRGAAVAAVGGAAPGTNRAEAIPPDATGIHRVSEQSFLVVESAPGHQPGSRYDVSGGATIGRGDVEIVLEDPFSSSRHARLDRQGGIMVLEDLGSTNGTYLNEELVTGPQPLHPGDRVRIGDSIFSFQS